MTNDEAGELAMCEKCDQIMLALSDAKMRAKSEHRDLHRAANGRPSLLFKAAEAEGGYQYLRRFESEAKKIVGST